MHRTSSKSLKVQRETLRVLVSSELGSVQGGGTIGYSTDTNCPTRGGCPDIVLPPPTNSMPVTACASGPVNTSEIIGTPTSLEVQTSGVGRRP